MYTYTELPESEWLPQHSHDGNTEPYCWIIGYYDELGIPLFKTAQWYQDKMDSITESPYRGPSYTEDELDEKWNEAARSNQRHRRTDF